MNLSFAEKVKIIMNRRNLNMTSLAEVVGQSRQNLSNKFARNNFSEEDIRTISQALGCSVDIVLTMTDTGEKI